MRYNELVAKSGYTRPLIVCVVKALEEEGRARTRREKAGGATAVYAMIADKRQQIKDLIVAAEEPGFIGHRLDAATLARFTGLDVRSVVEIVFQLWIEGFADVWFHGIGLSRQLKE
jgi:DNA-binding MarR family transcriptional regulator